MPRHLTPVRWRSDSLLAQCHSIPKGMTDRALHICLVCNELPPATAGGIGPYVATMARELARLEHRVTIVGLYDRVYEWNYPGIHVRPVLVQGRSRSKTRRLLRHLTNRVLLRQEITRIHAENHVDVVEWPDYEGLFLRPIQGVTDIVRNHGPLMSHRLHGLAPKIRHVEWLERHALRSITNWTGVSFWFMNEWLGITGARPRRTAVLYNPVDCTVFRPPVKDRRTDLILYSGALLERKGVFALARAANIFLKALPDARLMLVGRDVHGYGKSRILAELEHEVVPRVDIVPPLPQHELAQLMQQAAMFAMPSLLESFGNVWAEAMASGLPVLGSTLTCGPEIVPNGEAGLLVDPRDANAIALTVIRLMNDLDMREQLGTAGRRIALERYSTAAIVPRTVDFYRECASVLSNA